MASTTKSTWSNLPASGAVIEAVHNLPGQLLATSSVDGRDAYVQIWEHDEGKGEWDIVGHVQVPAAVTKLAWAHPECGPLVVGASDSGHLYVMEAPRPRAGPSGRGAQPGADGGDEAMGEAGQEEGEEEARDWALAADLGCSELPIRHLAFAPRQHGLLLAAASDDGHVYVYEADRQLAPGAWVLLSKFAAAVPDAAAPGASSSGRPPACTSLSWRPFSPGVAPLLVVGTKAGAAEVWQYSDAVMAWQHATSLAPSAEDDGAVASVHWAPTMGREVDLIAFAHGRTVDVYSLKGDVGGQLAAECVASLEHGAEVWKVEFNKLGTCLACATEANGLHLYKSDFVGQFVPVHAIQGTPDADAGGAASPRSELVD